MRKKVAIKIIMLITFSVIYWQVPNGMEKAGAAMTTTNPTTVEMEWNTTFWGTGDEYAYCVIQTSEGGFAIVGCAWSYGAGSTETWLVKTDAMGQAEWNSTFGGTGSDRAYSLIQTSDGGFVLAGDTWSYDAGSYDMVLVKTDANGQHEWNTTFGGTGYDSAYSLLQTSDGGFVLAGCAWSYGAGSTDMWLVKTNAMGQAEWNSTFGGTSSDEAHSLIQTSDGGFVLAGCTRSYGAGSTDMWLVKTDAMGQAEWNSTFGGTSSDEAYSLIQTSDGGFALAGRTRSYGAGSTDMWLVKTDANGQHEWNTTFGGTGDDSAYSFLQTSDGGFVLAGCTWSYGAHSTDMWLVKTNANGQHEWNTTFGGTGDEYASSFLQTSDGGFVLAGYTRSYGAGSYDMWLVKTASTNTKLILSWVPILILIVLIISLIVTVFRERMKHS